jgi:hypothetical protein
MSDADDATTPEQAPVERRLRLLEVVVQPTLVVDDGESLRKMVADPVVIQATDWETWAASAFSKEALVDLLATLDPPPTP